jgi:hypothetical protein
MVVASGDDLRRLEKRKRRGGGIQGWLAGSWREKRWMGGVRLREDGRIDIQLWSPTYLPTYLLY